MSEATARLTAELEAAVLRELLATWHELNAAHFKRRMRPPTLSLTDGVGRLGRWVGETREIEVARLLVAEKPWGTIVEVLKHEMAHQFVYEVLGRHDEPPHGPAFRETCERLGID